MVNYPMGGTHCIFISTEISQPVLEEVLDCPFGIFMCDSEVETINLTDTLIFTFNVLHHFAGDRIWCKSDQRWWLCILG